MTPNTYLKDAEAAMTAALVYFKKSLSGLRTGRASPELLNSIRVSHHGSTQPISNFGHVSVIEPQMLQVSVWNADASRDVDKAIRESSLGLNPILEGSIIRVPIPALTEERRREMIKQAKSLAENARVSIRNSRRDTLNYLKARKDIPDHIKNRDSKNIGTLTSSYIADVDAILSTKEKEII